MSATAVATIDEIAEGTEAILEQHVAPPRPTYHETLTAIIEDTHALGGECDYRTAAAVYNLCGRARSHIRSRTGDMYHLYGKELGATHDVLDLIMVDDAEPMPGSAHAMLNERLLPAGRTFVHTKDLHRGRVYCAIAMEVRPT